MALAIGYTVVMGWIFKYTAIAITGDMHAMARIWRPSAATSTSLRSATLPWIIVAIVASFAIGMMGVSGA